MARQPNWAVLLRVFPLILAVFAILFLKQKCGDSTAKMFDVMTDSPPAGPKSPLDLGTNSPTGNGDLSAPR